MHSLVSLVMIISIKMLWGKARNATRSAILEDGPRTHPIGGQLLHENHPNYAYVRSLLAPAVLHLFITSVVS